MDRARGRRCRGVSLQVLRDARVETCPCSQEQLDSLSPAGKGKPKPPWTGFSPVRVLMFLLSASSSASPFSAHSFFPFPHSWHPGGSQSLSLGSGGRDRPPPEKVGTAAASGAGAAVNARVTHPPRSLIPCTPNRFSLFSVLTPISGITNAAELSGFSKSLMNAS